MRTKPLQQREMVWMDLIHLMPREEVRRSRQHSEGFHLHQVPKQAKLTPAVRSQRLPLGQGRGGARRLSGVLVMPAWVWILCHHPWCVIIQQSVPLNDCLFLKTKKKKA